MFITQYKKQLVIIAALIMIVSVAIIANLKLQIGIDFTGGSLTEVSYELAPDKTQVETNIVMMDLGGVSVRESVDESGRDAFLVRTRDLNEAERVQLEETLVTIGTGGEISRFTSIGPVIGQELKDKAIWAILGVVAIIVLYIAFAFAGIGTPISSWVYGFVTIVVLVHDVLVPTAIMSLLGYFYGVEVDVLFVMAILAVLGYSVNDTIVIFDRVRENLVNNRTEKRTKHVEPGGIEREDVVYTLTAPYAELVGKAVKETLARSINTSLTTLVALTALYFIGGAVTQTFALILMAGVVAGAYSSIFIASPLVIMYADYKARKDNQPTS